MKSKLIELRKRKKHNTILIYREDFRYSIVHRIYSMRDYSWDYKLNRGLSLQHFIIMILYRQLLTEIYQLQSFKVQFLRFYTFRHSFIN